MNLLQGFRKVDPDRWEFAHEGFLGGQRHLLKNIRRRKNTSQNPKQQQQNALDPCVELGQFGVEGEIERLQRDRRILKDEIVKLKQQQQSSRIQVAEMEERLQSTERKQQQMMAFLAKALKYPTFIQQLMQRHKQMELGGLGKKKRRLPSAPSSESLVHLPEEASEHDIDTLLSVMGSDVASSSVQDREAVIESVNPNTTYAKVLEELLGDEFPIPIGDGESEIPVEVDDLVASPLDDWDEDVQSLVGQMDFLAGPKP